MSAYDTESTTSSTDTGFCVLRSKTNVCDCDLQTSDKSSTTPTKRSSDVVHYLSPISAISPRTVCEGDFYDYEKLLYKYYPYQEKHHEITPASTSSVSFAEEPLQKTLAIVRPHAMVFEDVIVRAIIEAGFAITRQRHVHLTPEQVSEIYAKHYGSPSFPHMVVSMSVGPVLVMTLTDFDAVEKWKRVIGQHELLREEWFYPISMKKRFGLRAKIPDALHGSKTCSDAIKENIYFFPDNYLEPTLSQEEKVEDYIMTYLNPTLLNALAELVKVKPEDPVMFLGQNLLLHNPYQPKLPPKIAMLPT